MTYDPCLACRAPAICDHRDLFVRFDLHVHMPLYIISIDTPPSPFNYNYNLINISSVTFFDVDALDAQQFAQSRNLLLQFADEFGVGVFVDDRLADDLLGPVGIPSNNTNTNFICEIECEFQLERNEMKSFFG